MARLKPKRPPLQMALIADPMSKRAKEAQEELKSRYNFIDARHARGKANVIVVLGGDGFMLQVMHRFITARNMQFYGMNCGTVGFLMNSYDPEGLAERVLDALKVDLHPLKMFAETTKGKRVELLALNEVALLRHSRQAAHIKVTVDHVTRIEKMVADGILVATPAGSSAYNFSAGGSILPLDSNLVALTPLSPFRPRRWTGALLPHTASIFLEILDNEKRPVNAVADFTEVRDIASVLISEQREIALSALFDPDHDLEERMIREQFMT